jgi:segregation and condensation protein B
MARDVPPKPARQDNDLELANFRQVPDGAGVPLDQLSAALTGVLGAGDDPYSPRVAAESSLQPDRSKPATLGLDEVVPLGEADGPCEVTPRSILEAMLFVGSPTNEPLTSKQVAVLMRGVRPAEIDALVRDLNRDYQRRNCPYTIAAQGAGYRLTLREEFARVRDKFYGRTRQTRLSRAAVEVLAAVAYHAPVTANEISRLRGVPSGPVLVQLVRRQLLHIERGTTKPQRVLYYTTSRFLELFGLQNLEDLPRSLDLEEP